jgi:hypothetical protein
MRVSPAASLHSHVLYKSPPFDLATAPAYFFRTLRGCGVDMRTLV